MQTLNMDQIAERWEYHRKNHFGSKLQESLFGQESRTVEIQFYAALAKVKELEGIIEFLIGQKAPGSELSRTLVKVFENYDWKLKSYNAYKDAHIFGQSQWIADFRKVSSEEKSKLRLLAERSGL